jgi:adenylate cyclase
MASGPVGPPRTLDGMRVPRTFGFVDLSGFTNFTAEFGDDAAADVLASFRSVTRRVASDRGVRIAKWLGDGCMIVAVDEADGIATVLDIERLAGEECRPLALRAGIASGYALLFEGDDYIGSAVNLAARLCDRAGPGEVLMPTDPVQELPEGVVAGPPREFSLHGFPEPVRVTSLTGTPVVQARHDTGELWTRSPFVA